MSELEIDRKTLNDVVDRLEAVIKELQELNALVGNPDTKVSAKESIPGGNSRGSVITAQPMNSQRMN